MTSYNFTITVIVGRSAEREAQRKLDSYISTGSSSIKNAIESDKTLGGNAYDCRVVSMNSVGSVTISDTTYLAADFTVTVIAN
jgi:transketolase